MATCRARLWVCCGKPAWVHRGCTVSGRVRMAIYGLKHKTIGRSTHRAGTAAAHARYILRKAATTAVIAEHMPDTSAAVQRWLLAEEEGDRKNARVIDKALLSLPIELGLAHWQKMVREFFAVVGKGRISCLASIHAESKDAGNPHAHVAFRDRDFETGKRVAQLSEKGSTDRLRKLWADIVNKALKEAGESARVDHRKKSEQKPPKKAAPKLAMEKRRKSRKQEYRRNWRKRYKVRCKARRNRKKAGPVVRKPQQDTSPVFHSLPSKSLKGALRTCTKSCASVAADPPPKGALTTRRSFDSVRGGIVPIAPDNLAPASRRSHCPQSFGAPGPPRPG